MTPLRKLAGRVFLGIALAFTLVYIGDSISVRMRMQHATANDPFESVTALRILAIADKGNKTEYAIDQAQPQQTAECVHALFPHNGDLPCWYLKRKFAQPIPMTIVPAYSWRSATIGSTRMASRAGT